MRKIFVCLALFLLTLTLTAWGEQVINVVGTWTLEGQVVSTDGYNPVEITMDITDQQGNLFRGHLNPVDSNDPQQHTNFYGAIVDKNIYLSFLDTAVQGTVDRRGTTIDFVAQQIQFDPSHRHPGTFVGTATKD